MKRYLFLLLIFLTTSCIANTQTSNELVNAPQVSVSTNSITAEVHTDDKFLQESIEFGKKFDTSFYQDRKDFDKLRTFPTNSFVDFFQTYGGLFMLSIMGIGFFTFFYLLWKLQKTEKNRGKHNDFSSNKYHWLNETEDWNKSSHNCGVNSSTGSPLRSPSMDVGRKIIDSSFGSNNFGSNTNPATGLPMASPSVDIGGNSFGCNNNRSSYPY